MALRGLLAPDYYYRTLPDIELDRLRSDGIDTLLLDLDNTIMPRDAALVEAELTQWAHSLRREGFKFAIVSNNWTARVARVAEELSCPAAVKALKPLPFGFKKAIRLLGSAPGHSAVVGDQLFTDVLGGKLLGLRTILVDPSSSSDLPHTLLLRRLEARIMAGRRPLA